jgi:hypothetical protein
LNCKGNKSCVWPAVKDKLCAFHLRDLPPQQPFYPDRPFSMPRYEEGTGRKDKLGPKLEAARMLVRGCAVSEIVNVTGLHENTVFAVRNKLRRAKLLPTLCRCGKPHGHNGRC